VKRSACGSFLTAERAGSRAWPLSFAGVCDRQADSCRGCCAALNFFANRANAGRWLAEHDEVRGQIVSIEDAVVSGRAVFRDVFAER
jgi:Alkylmercury lyase